jgi:predicted PurR-regulated permease PerM
MDIEFPRNIHSIKKGSWITGITILILIIITLLKFVFHFVLMAFAGTLLAIFLYGLASFIKKKTSIPRGLALFLVIFFLVLIFAGMIFLSGPRFMEQISLLIDKIPQAESQLRYLLEKNEWLHKLFSGSQQTLSLGGNILGKVTGIFSNIFDALVTVFIILIVGIYLAANPTIYIHGIISLLPHKGRKRGGELFQALGHGLKWWLFGRIMVMVIVGVFTAIGFSIIQFPLAITLGAIAGFTAFIPYLGPLLAAIPALLIALTEQPILLLYGTIVFVFIHVLEGYILTPMIQQRAVSIPPAVLITVQILMGYLGGILGILLATPIALVFIIIIQMLYVEDYLGEKVKVLGQHMGKGKRKNGKGKKDNG